MRITIDIPFGVDAFAALADEVQRAMRFALSRAAIRIQRECRNIAPVRTGRLRQSFKTGVVGEGIEMTWGAPYAEAVDIGALPHTITAKGPFLQFRDSRTGEWVRKKSVAHKGFTGRFYRLKASQKAMGILNEEIAAAMARIRVRAS